MLNRLFKPKWQHDDPSIRQSAISKLDNEKDEKLLAEIAFSDPSANCRRKAIEKIGDEKTLEGLLNKTESAEQWCLIASRLSIKKPELMESLVRCFNDASFPIEKSIKAIAHCENIELSEQLMFSLNDNQYFMELTLSAKSIALRLKALEKISDPDALSVIVKKAGHKQVIQEARQKLNRIKEEEKNKEAAIESANKIISALERLAKQTWNLELANNVERLNQQWKELDQDLVCSCRTHYDKANAACEAEIAARHEEALKLKKEKEALKKQEGFCEQLSTLIHEVRTENLSSVQSIKDALQILDKNQEQLSNEQTLDTSLSGKYLGLHDILLRCFKAWDRFEELSNQIQTHVELSIEEDLPSLRVWIKEWHRMIKQLDWPKEFAKPSQFNEWYAVANKIKGRCKKIEQEQKHKATYISRKIKALETQIAQKNLISANKLSNYIAHQTEELIEEFSKNIQKQRDKIEPDLNELRDWHLFATSPKKETLCSQMKELAENPKAPLQQAEQVRKLQEQWRELIASDSNADQELWDQFKTTADAAYKPCLTYYAEQDLIKSQNLEKQLQFCEQLEQQLKDTDWEKVDWKALDKQYVNSGNTWKTLHPVPQNEKKAVQKRFDKSLKVLKDKLSQEKQRNLDLKIELVEKAKSLLDSDDILKAIEQAKKIQIDWKNIGITFYKADKEQWQQLRHHIDKLFSLRDEQKKSFLSQLKENEHLVKQLTQQIKELSSLPDETLKSKYSEFEALTAQFDRSLELPRKSSQKVLANYDDAIQHFKSHFNGISSRKKRQSIVDLKVAATLLQEAEESILNGKPFDKESLLKQFEDLQFDRESIQPRIDLLSTQSQENSAGKESLLSLLLNGEIMVGIDSPSDFKEQRMAIQLEQLKVSMGASLPEENIEQHVMEIFKQWANTGFITPDDRSSINARMLAVLKAINIDF